MEALYAWTIALCFATTSPAPCDAHHRAWLTSGRTFHSLSECDGAWRAHVAALRARPGWAREVTVAAYLCAQGMDSRPRDPLSDVRERIVHGL